MTTSFTFLVDGMHCTACLNRVEQAILELSGVEAAYVSLTDKRVEIEFRDDEITPAKICQKIERAGYAARLL